MTDKMHTLERCLTAYNGHDAPGFASCWAENGFLRVANGDIAEGRDQIEAGAADRFRAFPDWHLATRAVYDCAEHVWLEWTITGTHEGEFLGIPPTHRRFEVHGCSHLRFGADGLIEDDIVYFDLGAWLRQLGLLPESEATQAA